MRAARRERRSYVYTRQTLPVVDAIMRLCAQHRARTLGLTNRLPPVLIRFGIGNKSE